MSGWLRICAARAFACKISWDKGYDGFVAFQSKTKLIEHYEVTLGATHIGGHKMIIFPLLRSNSFNNILKTKYMGHIKEPAGIDLNVSPMPLSVEDRKALSLVIAQYKLTKEVPKSKSKLAKTVSRKRTTKPGAKSRKPAAKKGVVMPSK